MESHFATPSALEAQILGGVGDDPGQSVVQLAHFFFQVSKVYLDLIEVLVESIVTLVGRSGERSLGFDDHFPGPVIQPDRGQGDHCQRNHDGYRLRDISPGFRSQT